MAKKKNNADKKLQLLLDKVNLENLQLKAELIVSRKRIAQLEFSELERVGKLIDGELGRIQISKVAKPDKDAKSEVKTK